MPKYQNFIYNNYEILEDNEKIYFKFYFEIENLSKFEPKIEILKKDFKWNHLKSNILSNIVFNLGMVEAISYFKAVCPENFIINCGALNEYQENWFRKLFYLGLGEFRYKNKIQTSEENFVKFQSNGKLLELEEIKNDLSGIIIPVGGGKDSNVTLELLKNKFDNINCFLIDSKDVSIKCTEIAGFSRDSVIEVKRTIDRNLIGLNEKGFLNGHTPFSAMLAFLSYAVSFMLDKKYVVLSNESSANEANVEGQNINHQYSKTLEFENDFRDYAKKFLMADVEYFSFLRPISELQIAMIFSRFDKYLNVFKSCNVGSKSKPWKWCCNCPKCLFVYIMLRCFLKEEKMIEIFGENLLEKESLLETFIELCGYGEIKPFECVGTFEEVRFCVNKIIKEYNQDDLPFLLKYYKNNFEIENIDDSILKKYNNENNLPIEFSKILKENI